MQSEASDESGTPLTARVGARTASMRAPMVARTILGGWRDRERLTGCAIDWLSVAASGDLFARLRPVVIGRESAARSTRRHCCRGRAHRGPVGATQWCAVVWVALEPFRHASRGERQRINSDDALLCRSLGGSAGSILARSTIAREKRIGMSILVDRIFAPPVAPPVRFRVAKRVRSRFRFENASRADLALAQGISRETS
jgi:hypothetical protein